MPENTQLLCLTRHREESAHEMASCIKLFDLRLQAGAKDVYIVTPAATQGNKRSPLEAIENGCGLSLLTFTRVNRVFSRGLRKRV